MRYGIRARRLLPGDQGWFVVQVDEPELIEASISDREQAVGYAEALNRWWEARPEVDTDRVSFAEPGDVVTIVDGLKRIEPTRSQLLTYERRRLEAGQRLVKRA